jgi:hypothetical protein
MYYQSGDTLFGERQDGLPFEQSKLGMGTPGKAGKRVPFKFVSEAGCRHGRSSCFSHSRKKWGNVKTEKVIEAGIGQKTRFAHMN